MEVLLSPEGLLSLLTLTFLEIVLGIDNIIFISLISNDLEAAQQPLARRLGLGLALGFRVLMLLGITWLIGLTEPIFHLGEHPVSGRDAILFLGGVFFAAIGSYFIALIAPSLSFTNWLILSVLVSVFGTLGDLVESKYKRQALVKDSGKIMPGHGGMLDRLDSAIFAAPFIYLFLRILNYVS